MKYSIFIFGSLVLIGSCNVISRMFMPVKDISAYQTRQEVLNILDSQMVGLEGVNYVLGFRDSNYIANSKDSLLYTQQFNIFNSKGIPLKLPAHCNQNTFIKSNQFSPYNLEEADKRNLVDIVGDLSDVNHEIIKFEVPDSIDYFIKIDWSTFAKKYQNELLSNLSLKYEEKHVFFLLVNKDLIIEDSLFYVNKSIFRF